MWTIRPISDAKYTPNITLQMLKQKLVNLCVLRYNTLCQPCENHARKMFPVNITAQNIPPYESCEACHFHLVKLKCQCQLSKISHCTNYNCIVITMSNFRSFYATSKVTQMIRAKVCHYRSELGTNSSLCQLGVLTEKKIQIKKFILKKLQS